MTPTFTNPSIGNPLSLTLVKNKTRDFSIQNNGSLSTSAFRMTITMTVVINSAERFDVGVVFTATDGVCESGTATTIAISVGIPTTITLLMAPNTFYDIQIIGNKNETATIDLSVLTPQLGTRTINS